MTVKYNLFIIFGLLFNITISEVLAQCTVPPLETSFACSGGNGIFSNGQTINNGEVFWFTGTASYANQVIIEKGETFIICGDLTLNGGINIKGDAGGKGNLIIKAGGSLTINSNTSVDGLLYNYGDLIVNNDFTINAGGAQFINATASN